MFNVRSVRQLFGTFISDNNYREKTTSRCRSLTGKIMSQLENGCNKETNDDETIATEDDERVPTGGYSLRRARSANEITNTLLYTSNYYSGAPNFYMNNSCWPNSPVPQPFLQNCPIFNSYYNSYNSQPFSPQYFGSCLSPMSNSELSYSGGGLPPCSSQQNLLRRPNGLDDSRRTYYVRRNNSADSLPMENVNPKVFKVLSKRYWENAIKKPEKPDGNTTEFTVMSYNVLAQDLINEHPYLYKNHNPCSLHWEKRWKNLYKEIKSMHPDIMCLQEVQASHLKEFYSKLATLGYKGVYKKRTGIRTDGCAIYYKTDRFDMVEYETVEYFQPAVSVLNRDNVAIVAKFRPRSAPQEQFVVANTHLLYNPKRQDVRLAQTQLLLSEVERLSYHRLAEDKKSYWPVIITGDFNSTPDSTVYELITKGSLKYSHLSARTLDNYSKSTTHGNVLVPSTLEITDNCQHAILVEKRDNNERFTREEEASLIKLHHSRKKASAKVETKVVQNPELFSSGKLSHLFPFKSAYEHGEPDNTEGTTYQDKWISVDYIFYSGKIHTNEEPNQSNLQLVSRYRLPRRTELGSIKVPNSLMGSDHLSLIAKFILKI